MVNSLSNYVRLMARLHFERAEVFPQVNRIGDARHTALVNLRPSARDHVGSNYPTISAASVPAIENSRSAYFFQ